MHSCCCAAGLGCGSPQASASPADPGQLESVTSSAPSRSPQAKRQPVSWWRRDELVHHAVNSLIDPDPPSVFDPPLGKPSTERPSLIWQKTSLIRRFDSLIRAN